MGKILDDILKLRGKYSLKRVLAVITFVYVINLSVYVSYTDKPNGVAIITSLLAFITSLLITAEIGKKFTDKDINTPSNE